MAGSDDPSPDSRGGRVKDVRGRTVRQLDPIALHLLHEHDVIDARTLRAIANEDGVRIKGGERAALAGSVCCALGVVGLFTHAFITGDLRNGPSARLVGMLYICSMPWILWFGIRRKRLGNVAAAMLEHARCPHCGYDLNGLQPDPDDGATVCPECGCAWALAAS
jgi:hypothetical protein